MFVVATRLGLTSFGGPVAHLGYFHNEYVRRRKWLDTQTYSEIVALAHFLPGPSSSQIGIAVGITRAGLMGGVFAWLGFTLPSTALLIFFAYGINGETVSGASWLNGLQVVAVAVVAVAVLDMAKRLCPDRSRKTFAIAAVIPMLFIPHVITQILVIAAGGLLGLFLLKDRNSETISNHRFPINRTVGLISIMIFLTLLLGLPVILQVIAHKPLEIFDSFFRSGSLVFGGGHVVLPLLEAEVVPNGWVSKESFATGYAVAQAVPGPLFTFSAYLGTAISTPHPRWLLGLLATFAIFLPSFLLVTATLPFWNTVRSSKRCQKALMGINAVVVGLLITALYSLLVTIQDLQSHYFAIGFASFSLLAFFKCPPWVVLILATLASYGIGLL
ncbi:MAG: chromate transporter [Chloroflexi bacterium]|nr:MAG: chromate transporter [Chloroflexota bacterium]